MRRTTLLSIGLLCFTVGTLITAGSTWHFYCDEMTQGAYLKAYWREIAVGTALLAVGGLCWWWSEEE